MSPNPRISPVLALLFLSSALVSAEVRPWAEAAGGTTLEGDSVSSEAGLVKVADLSLAKLSDEDQASVGKQAESADWPTWRGPNRDNISPDTGLLKEWPEGGPKLLWTFEQCGKGYSSPSIVGGRMYVTGSRDGKAQMICLNADTGEELWSSPIGDDPEKGYNTGWGGGPRGAVAVSEGLAYAMTANGEFTCVSAEDGSRKWHKDLVKDFGGKVPQWGYSESPLVDGDKVLVTPGGEGGAIVAFDKKTGAEVWKSKDLTDNAAYSSLVVGEMDGKRQYVQLFMKTVAGVDAETGALSWTSPWPKGRTAVIPTPIYQDGKVYITSGYGAGSKLIQLGGGEAKDLWVSKAMKVQHGGAVLLDGHIYGLSDGGGLVCQSLENGEQVWNEKSEGTQKGAVSYADGMLYCLDEAEGSVFLAEASSKGFKEHGRFSLPKETELREGTRGKVWTHPVIIGGRLYLRDQDLVFCYSVKE